SIQMQSLGRPAFSFSPECLCWLRVSLSLPGYIHVSETRPHGVTALHVHRLARSLFRSACLSWGQLWWFEEYWLSTAHLPESCCGYFVAVRFWSSSVQYPIWFAV